MRGESVQAPVVGTISVRELFETALRPRVVTVQVEPVRVSPEHMVDLSKFVERSR